MSESVRPTNGVSFGVKHTCSAQNASDNFVLFDFGVGYGLVASVTVTSSAGVGVDMSGVTVTYPADGQVKVAFTCTAGQIVHLVANRDYNG